LGPVVNFFAGPRHFKLDTVVTRELLQVQVTTIGDFGWDNTHQAVEIVRRWTGANERTVKNWFAGKNSPGGEHLIMLLHHSDDVLEAVLRLAHRPTAIKIALLATARDAIIELLRILDSILEE